MSQKNKDNVGVIYLFTNDCYEKENTYKYGISQNPFQRKMIQTNSTPPTHPFYYKIVMFSPDYKKIENWLKKRFKSEGYLLDGDGGKEWVKADFSNILNIYKDSLSHFSKETIMCFGGKRYEYNNGTIEEHNRLPNCSLKLLGIPDGDEITCIKNGISFQVRKNNIVVSGSEMSLSNYMSKNYKRSGNTNEYNGYKYFTYKNYNLYDRWQSLVRCK